MVSDDAEVDDDNCSIEVDSEDCIDSSVEGAVSSGIGTDSSKPDCGGSDSGVLTSRDRMWSACRYHIRLSPISTR